MEEKIYYFELLHQINKNWEKIVSKFEVNKNLHIATFFMSLLRIKAIAVLFSIFCIISLFIPILNKHSILISFLLSYLCIYIYEYKYIIKNLTHEKNNRLAKPDTSTTWIELEISKYLNKKSIFTFYYNKVISLLCNIFTASSNNLNIAKKGEKMFYIYNLIFTVFACKMLCLDNKNEECNKKIKEYDEIIKNNSTTNFYNLYDKFKNELDELRKEFHKTDDFNINSQYYAKYMCLLSEFQNSIDMYMKSINNNMSFLSDNDIVHVTDEFNSELVKCYSLNSKQCDKLIIEYQKLYFK